MLDEVASNNAWLNWKPRSVAGKGLFEMRAQIGDEQSHVKNTIRASSPEQVRMAAGASKDKNQLLWGGQEGWPPNSCLGCLELVLGAPGGVASGLPLAAVGDRIEGDAVISYPDPVRYFCLL